MSDSILKNENKIVDKIKELVNENRLAEAKEILDDNKEHYEGIAEVYSISGIIALLEGDLDKAEACFLEGVVNNPSDFDLLYNLAYCFEQKNKHIDAFEFYSKAKLYTQDEQIKSEIDEILSRYNELDVIKEYKLRHIYVGNMGKPKAAIIIESYNQKDYLKEAIDSCIAQDYPNLEIIVADDCSTDGTDFLMQSYKDNDRIRYIRNEVNLGAGNNAQNALFNHTNAKYVKVLNHDDYFIKNDYISKSVDFLMKNPNVAFVWANCKILNASTGEFTYTNFRNKRIIKGFDYFMNYEMPGYPHITGILTTVYDLDKFKSANIGQEQTKSKDLFFYLKMMLCGDVGFIDDCAAVYRMHDESLSNNMPVEYDKTTIQEFELIRDDVLKTRPVDMEQMDIWINNRVYSYVLWRFVAMWNKGNKKAALDLLVSISQKYAPAYERILNSI